MANNFGFVCFTNLNTSLHNYYSGGGKISKAITSRLGAGCSTVYVSLSLKFGNEKLAVPSAAMGS